MTHPTPANVTPEEARKLANSLEKELNFCGTPEADNAVPALRSLADQIDSLTAAKRASEERDAILTRERDEAIDALEDARDNDTAQFEGLHELIGDVGKHLGFIADDYPVSAQDIIDAIEAERNALAERLRVAEGALEAARVALVAGHANVAPHSSPQRKALRIVAEALAAQPAGQGYTTGGTVMRVEGQPAEPSTGWDSPGPTP